MRKLLRLLLLIYHEIRIINAFLNIISFTLINTNRDMRGHQEVYQRYKEAVEKLNENRIKGQAILTDLEESNESSSL